MKHTHTQPERASFFSRVIVPAGAVCTVMVVSLLFYRHTRHMDPGTIKVLCSHLFAVLLFLSIGFGPFLVYPFAYFKGASTGERICASLFTPAVWSVKEVVRVGEYFTFWESLYYGLNSLILLTLFINVGIMGLCEILCRALDRRSGANRRVFTPVPVTGIILALAALYVMLIWGFGVHWFYIYMQGYRAIFT